MVTSELSAHVIVAQTHRSRLSEIERAISSTSPHYVSLVRSPAEVLERIPERPHMVITGTHFYEGGIEEAGPMGMLSAMLEGPAAVEALYRPPAGGWMTGGELAREIRRLSPETLVLRYSGTPEDEPSAPFHGEVPKLCGPSGPSAELIHLLEEPELRSIIEGREWEALRSRHPGITWYRLPAESGRLETVRLS